MVGQPLNVARCRGEHRSHDIGRRLGSKERCTVPRTTAEEFQGASELVEFLIFAGHDLRLAAQSNDWNHAIRTLHFGLSEIDQINRIVSSVEHDLNLHVPDGDYRACLAAAPNVHYWSIGNFKEIEQLLLEKFCTDASRSELLLPDIESQWPSVRATLAALPRYDAMRLQMVLWNERSFVVDRLDKGHRETAEGQRTDADHSAHKDIVADVGNGKNNMDITSVTESVGEYPDSGESANGADQFELVPGSAVAAAPEASDMPDWDGGSLKLKFRDVVVKTVRNRKRARNVVTVLDAFQKKDWSEPVGFPLSGLRNPEQLRDTVKSLNEGLAQPLTFFSDGTGENIDWRIQE